MALSLLPLSAKASTIVYSNGNPQVVQAILGLTVGTTTYNVTFGNWTLDSTFFGDAFGAQAAVNAI
ncbi:MAG: hypothetical protein ACTHJX_05995, partial [Terriglobales bacterium]